MQRGGRVTADRGHGDSGRTYVRVRREARVRQRHEQQRPAQAAHQPRKHAAAHRAWLACRLEHVAHQPGAELGQQTDGGRDQRAASAQRVVDGQRELGQARDRVDGAPGRVAAEQQSPRRWVATPANNKTRAPCIVIAVCE